jgi:replicative DNA helicase
VVFIDYLQLIRSVDSRVARYEVVDNICQGLRNIAKEKDIAVVLLCQLNRESEKRENHRPRLSDLRESGGIEQTADKIIFLYRPSYYLMYEQQERNNYGDDSEAYMIIAKNRNGRLEDVPAVWEAEYMSFRPATFELENF